MNKDSTRSQLDTNEDAHDATRTTYLQVRTLVERLRRQHRRLHSGYESQQANPNVPTTERSDLLLRYLSEGEKVFDDFLDRFTDSERQGILDTWIQYGDLGRFDRLVDDLVELPPSDPRETIAKVAELDRELVRLYERLAGQVTQPMVKRFFGDLRDVSLERMKQHAEDLGQVEML